MSGFGFLIGTVALATVAWHICSSDTSSAHAFTSGPITMAVLQEPGDIPLARAPLFGQRVVLSGDPVQVDLVIVNTGSIPFDVSFRPVPNANADGVHWEARSATGRILRSGAVDGNEAPMLSSVMPGERVPWTLSMTSSGAFDDVQVRYQFVATQSPPAAPWTVAR
jgi:hypothetical protein